MFYELLPCRDGVLIIEKSQEQLLDYDVKNVDDDITICNNLKLKRFVAISNLEEVLHKKADDICFEIAEQIEIELIGEDVIRQENEFCYSCCEPM